ncbi:hypothetical protein COCOBI_15-2570 [Coccomyxa sp. Obi]|nr:hypothetical protein COCOBI_15-2570 [Coccomyxa sp. Obi]
MEIWTRLRSTLAPNNGAETRRPSSHVVEEVRRSSSSDASAANRHDGDSMLSKAEGRQSGGEGFTGPLAQAVSSDSNSDPGLNSDEEALFKLGDGLWIHEKYLAYLAKSKDIDTLLYQEGQPGDIDHGWMAIAPEWTHALGFGSTKEEASVDLQSKLVSTKLSYIEEKDVIGIKLIPVEPCKKDAVKVRYSRRRAKYYDRLERESTAFGWSSIKV